MYLIPSLPPYSLPPSSQVTQPERNASLFSYSASFSYFFPFSIFLSSSLEDDHVWDQVKIFSCGCFYLFNFLEKDNHILKLRVFQSIFSNMFLNLISLSCSLIQWTVTSAKVGRTLDWLMIQEHIEGIPRTWLFQSRCWTRFGSQTHTFLMEKMLIFIP